MSEPLPGSAGVVTGARPALRSVTRPAWAALLAALVLLGGLEIHPAGESHDPVAGLSGHHNDVYFLGASHPVAPPHAETATPVQRPLCAFCLTRLQSMGAQLDRAARLATALLGSPPPPAVAALALQRPLLPDGARAPPSA
jgi:hypothetical protein